MKKVERLLIRIEESQKEKLSKVAADNKRSMSDYVRLIIELAIQNKTKV